MRKLILPIFLSIIFISESIFVELFADDNVLNKIIYAPHFLLISLCLSALFINRNLSLIYSFVFGFIYDIFYTDILGIYSFLFTLIVYLFSLLMKALNSHLIVVTIVSLTGIIILEVLVYGILIIFKDTSMIFSIFIKYRVFPTILLNFCFMLFLGYLIKKLFVYIKNLNYTDL
ncbi:MAG: mreD [Bacillales bacterium]|jgi:rod shape-determining protein MreD|nr:mreD [Bacillales bacterium]